MDLKVIGCGKGQFGVVSLSEQTVKLKIHWLPLYFSNRLLKAIFCDYGEVLDVNFCKSSYAHVCALNGLREVVLRMDEIKKQKIPHLVKLCSGQSILVTMEGRPPLCLKCSEIGHTRNDCPYGRMSYTSTVRPNGAVVHLYLGRLSLLRTLLFPQLVRSLMCLRWQWILCLHLHLKVHLRVQRLLSLLQIWSLGAQRARRIWWGLRT